MQGYMQNNRPVRTGKQGVLCNTCPCNPCDGTFTTTWLTTSPSETITLPLVSGYTYNATVNWGDGTPDSNITAWDDVDKTHLYASSGSHTVTISGIFESFAFRNTGDRNKITGVNFNGKKFGSAFRMFHGCENLTSVSGVLGVCDNLIELDVMFRGCTSLVSVPGGIFVNISGVNTSCRNMFTDCTSLTTLGANFFNGLDLNADANFIFMGCSSLNNLPSDLFDGMLNVTETGSAFRDCVSLATIPSSLFTNNTILVSASRAFQGCTSLGSIPSSLFSNCTELASVSYSFNSCDSLGSIPSGIFNNNQKIETFVHAFSQCSSLTGTSKGLWLNPSGSPLYTLIAPNYDSGIPDGENCYFDSGGLSDFATIPTYWK